MSHPTDTAGRSPSIVRPLAGGMLALAAAMGIGRFAFTPILPGMEHAGELTTSQAGVLASANYAGYLTGALLLAVFAKRFTQSWLLWSAMSAVAITTAAMAALDGMAGWSISRYAAGVASAGVFIIASGLVFDELRRQQQSRWAGWLFAGPGIGIVISGVVVRATGRFTGWRSDWVLLGIIVAAVIYPCRRWLPRTRGGAHPTSTPPAAPLPAMSRALPLLFVAYTLEGIGYIVTGTFLASIVDHTRGGHGHGPDVWIVVGLAAIPAGVIWAAVAGRIGFAWALTAAFGLQAIGIAMPLLGGLPAAIVSAVLFGGTFIGITTLVLAFASRLSPGNTAGVIGGLTAGFGLGQVIGPVVAASITSHADDFGPALVGASSIVLLGGILMLSVAWLDPTRRGAAR